MSNFNNGIYELLLTRLEADAFKEDELDILEDVDDEWLINQFSRFLKEKLKQFQEKADKINYLNNFLKNDKLSELVANRKNLEKKFYIHNLSQNKIITRNLDKEMHQEFFSCDRIKIICPFLTKWSVTELREIIKETDESVMIKIITTTYNGESNFLDIEGLQKLVEDYPSRIRVKIENLFSENVNRLHIKSYLFERDSGFSSLYIGSSNFTKTGFVTGKEYSVKISEFREKEIIKQAINDFDNLFEDNLFIDILEKEKIATIKNLMYDNLPIEYLDRVNKLQKDYKPYDYQKEILVNFEKRLLSGIKKHLLIMATGTGKTATLAFIYGILQKWFKNNEPSLLYIAPSTEILKQAKETFRNILNIDDFGVDLYDVINPNLNIKKEKVIFTTNYTGNNKIEQFKDTYFDVVVFDEAHHLEATTFLNIYNAVVKEDNFVFGLTATPERTDGINVLKYFGDEPLVDIRLYDSLEKDFLCDVDYYFIKDNSIDLSGFDILKREGEYLKTLSSNKRNDFIYKTIMEHLGQNNSHIRAIMFCESVEQAETLDIYLKEHGEKSALLVSESKKMKKPPKEVISDFREGRVNYLCVRDMLNEGFDVPEVNCVFFLRPTTSKILYLQQLGRGLRKHLDKKLRVYDFVNNIDMKVNKRFNPLIPIQVLTKNLNLQEIVKKFNYIDTYLPGNTRIIMDEYIKQDLISKLKTFESNNLYHEIMESYVTGIFEDYESFFNDYGINIISFYKMRSFFKENRNRLTIFKKFSYINLREVLEGFYYILENKKFVSNSRINFLFLNSYFYSINKSNPLYNDVQKSLESIFEDDNKAFIKELTYLIKYKLKNDKSLLNNIVDESIESFKNIYLNVNQAKALLGKMVNMQSFTSDTQNKGIVRCLNNELLIDCSSETALTKDGHRNSYDYKNKFLYWESPNGWTTNENMKQKNQLEMENTKNFKTFVIYQSKDLAELKEDLKQLVGIVDKVHNSKQVQILKDGKLINKVQYTLEIK